MRTNTCSKAQAIALIQKAVKAGWTREVTTYNRNEPAGKYHYSSVGVLLKGSVQFGGLFDWVNIYLSVRRHGNRWSVSITSQANYQRKSKPGLWAAG